MNDIYAFLPSDSVFTSNGERPVQPSKAIERKDKDTWEVEVEVELDYADVFRQDYILFMKSQYGYQPFRINNVETLSKSYLATCKHIGFDILNHFIPLATPLELNCQDAMQYVLDRALPACPFTVYSDITEIKTLTVENMSLYDAMVTLTEAYGGFLDFDGFQLRIMMDEGEDRGETIEYGKNLIGATVTENWDKVVTDLMPVTTSGLYLPGLWLYSEIVYDRAYARRVEFETDTVENLAFLAPLYLARFEVPRINYDVKSEVLQGVYRGDIIKIIARQFTIQTDVISYEKDLLRDKTIACEFGNFRNTLRSFFGNLRGDIEAAAVKRSQLKINETNGLIEAIANDIVLIAGDITDLAAGSTVIESKIDGVTITVIQQTDALNNLQSDVDDNAAAINDTSEAVALQKSYYNFGDALTMGRNDSPAQIRMEIDTDSKPKVTITDGYNETVTIKSNSVKTPNIEVTESAIIGNHKVQKLTGSLTVTLFLPI
ncbi:MAG: phage tail spike protein [Erysipelotrichaceae bacterium]